MSSRDDQPATVPPPDGEDDAYNATTKVGAMPADIMEKLRAEGLLPDEVERDEKAKAAEKKAVSQRPAIPRPQTSAAPPSGPVPQLYSSPPSLGDHDEDEDDVATKFVQSPKMETTPPPEQPLAPPIVESIETPVAFAFPPTSQIPQMAEPVPSTPPASSMVVPASSLAPAPVPPQNAAKTGPSKVVLVLVALAVLVLLIVALMRLRR